MKEFDLQQVGQISMFFARDGVTQYIPDEYWYETLERQLDQHLQTFVRFRDQLDRGKFLSDLIKACVSFGLREIDTSLFKSKLENVVMSFIPELDVATVTVSGAGDPDDILRNGHHFRDNRSFLKAEKVILKLKHLSSKKFDATWNVSFFWSFFACLPKRENVCKTYVKSTFSISGVVLCALA